MDIREIKLGIDLAESDALWSSQLVAYRKKKGITQETVAQRMGVGQPVVSRLENLNSGERAPKPERLRAYARAIGVFTAHLVVDAEEDYELLKNEIETHLHAVRARDEGATPKTVYQVTGQLSQHVVPERKGTTGWTRREASPRVWHQEFSSRRRSDNAYPVS